MINSTRCLIAFLLFFIPCSITFTTNYHIRTLQNLSWAQNFDDEDFDEDDDDEDDDLALEEEDFDDENKEETTAKDSSKGQEEDFEDEDFGEEDTADSDFDDEDFDEGESFADDMKADSDGFDAFDDDALAVDESSLELNDPVTNIDENPIVPLDDNNNHESKFVSIESSSADNYDRDYENKLFKIYEDYYNFPVSESEWKNLTGDRKSEVYEIQRGDTLWDISTTFFGDGHYWPKIWSVNGRITNPHIISAGSSILFNLGDINSPPSFTVSDDGTVPPDVVTPDGEVDPLVSGQLADNANPLGGQPDVDINNNLIASNDSVKLPDTRLKIKPVINNLPGSLPSWGYPNSTNTDDFEVVARENNFLRNQKVPMTHFVRDNKIPTYGVMVEAEAGEKFATTGQYIYVELDTGANGSTYVIVNYEGLLKTNFGGDNVKGPFGHVYEAQGIIQVREPIDNGDKKGQKGKQLYRAYVESAFQPIKVGGLLIDEEPNRIEVSSSGDYNFTPAQITGGSGTTDSRILNVGMFAYINEGSLAGFVEGDKVAIISQRKIRREKTRLLGKLYKVGEGQIVDVSDKVATFLVTKAFREIMVGDYIGEPQLGKIGSPGASSSEELEFSDDGEAVEENLEPDEDDLEDFDSFEGEGSDESSDDDSFSDDEISDDGVDDLGVDDGENESEEDIDFDEEDDFSEGNIDTDDF